VDITQVPALIANDAKAETVMLEQYDAQPKMYQTLCDVRPVSETNLYGKNGTVIQGAGRFKKREDGAEIEADNPEQGPTWYCKIQPYGRRLDLPDRLVEGSSAGQIANMIREFAMDFGESAGLDKDDHVAGMWQKGSLTAGSLEYFDGRWVNGADPHPKYVYDGLPWFDTAHTLTGSSTTMSNHAVSRALTSANLQTTLTEIRTGLSLDERGQRIRLRPDTLIVPPELEFTARTVLESVLLPGGQNNDANVVRGALDLVVWDALTDTASAAAWWVSQRGRGVVCFDEAPRIKLVRDDLKGQWQLLAEFNFGAAVKNVRYDFCNNKAAS